MGSCDVCLKGVWFWVSELSTSPDVSEKQSLPTSLSQSTNVDILERVLAKFERPVQFAPAPQKRPSYCKVSVVQYPNIGE